MTKFVLLEHPPAAPGQWLIVNRLIDRDPDVRGDVFREDELKALAAVDGLAFDSAALFVLAEWADEHASDRAPLRSHLRGLKGQLTLQMARDWITAQSAA